MIRLTVLSVAILLLVTIGHMIYVDLWEFEPARAEWNSAHAQHNMGEMRKAYHKEEIAHCRTGDLLWFVHPAEFCDSAAGRQ